MASEGPNSGGTFGYTSCDVGNNAVGGGWTSTGNVATEDGTFSQTGNTSGSSFKELACKLIKAGSTAGTNQAGTSALPTSFTYLNYGGASSLWGTTLSDSDVNASGFGVAVAFVSAGGSGTAYLTATNFGFAIPSGATIDGVLVSVKCRTVGGNRPNVDHIRITVYYTEAGGSFADATGSSSITFSASATGSALVSAAGSSSVAFTPTAAGSALADVTGAATLTFTPSATSDGGTSATGSSSITFSASATGSAFVSAAGSAALSFAVSAAGSAIADAVGVATLAFSCSAASSDDSQVADLEIAATLTTLLSLTVSVVSALNLEVVVTDRFNAQEQGMPCPQVGDIGTPIVVTVRDVAGEIMPLGTTTLRQIILSRRGVARTYTASLYTDGADGKIVYVSQSGDFDLAGPWLARGRVEFGGGAQRWTSPPVNFTVEGS